MNDDAGTRSLWHDVGWPALAGLVIATGLLAAYHSIGLLACVAAFLLLELTIAPTAWSIMTDLGRSGGPAVLELAPACALGALVVFGLVSAAPLWSLPLLLLVLLTSPLCPSWYRSLAGRSAGPGSERAELRRTFDEIVSHGFADDQAGEDRPGGR
ncbi:MAG: hypothetical protein WB797_04400 [Nocardioides sp.]